MNDERARKRLDVLREHIEDCEIVDLRTETGVVSDDYEKELCAHHTVALVERDRDALLDFDDRLALVRSEVGVQRHAKLLGHTFRIAYESDASVADALESRDAAEDCVRWIHRAKPKTDSEETNRDYRVALRMFGKRVTDGDGIPPSLSWVNAGTSSDYNPTPNPANMISRDELDRLIDAAQNPRDAAIVAVAWDSGCRSGEFQDLTIGDVSDHEHGLRLQVDGKRGERNPTLIPSVPYLRQWLNFHPGSDDPDAPLWSKLDEPEPLSYRTLKDTFERLARRAERFDKPVTPTNFRKSRASDLASRGMSQAHLEDRMGWVRGSDAASRYISVFADAADREFARMEGVEVEETDDEVRAPVTCPRCDKETPHDEDVCMWCGQALDARAAQELDNAQDRLFESVVEADGELVEDLRALKNRLDDPEVRALLAGANES